MDSSLESLLIEAQAHSRAGRRGAALHILKQVIAQDPLHGEALEVAGYLSRDEGDFNQAADYLDAALRVLPASPARLREASLVNHRAGRLVEAAQRLEAFSAMGPPDAETLLRVGLAWAGANDSARAIVALQKAVRMFPMLWQMHYNLGLLFGQAGNYERELSCYDVALRLKPDAFDAHLNKAIALHALHRFDACLIAFKKAIQLNNRHAGARRKRAQTHMLLGDFAQGLRDYEYRWEEAGVARPYGDRIWDGKADLDGKVILLYNEQGLGDTLHYVRFVRSLATRGARIWLRVQAALVPLLENDPYIEGVFADVGVLPALEAHSSQMPSPDFHIPLMSLPLALNMSLATIPAPIPYVSASHIRIAEWGRAFAARESAAKASNTQRRKPKVGIVWSGNPVNTNDRPRSTQLAQWRSLLDLPAHFVSVQKEVRAADRALLTEYDSQGRLWDTAAGLASYAETAALVSTLDLLISVDTSVAHLSGALGKATWILLPFTPDPRWLLERNDSPWYPTATLYRQTTAGDWDGVFANIYQALAEFCTAFGAQTSP